MVPVEPEDAMHALEEVRMAVDSEKARFNRRAVDKLDFTATHPRPGRNYEAILYRHH